MIKQLSTLLIFCFALQACNTDLGLSIRSDEDETPDTQVLVFAQFNVPEEGDKLDSFWYYGEVSEKLYQSFSTNKIQSGFIRLKNVHYWGNDDVLYEYKDEEETGELTFRIEDIRRVRLINQFPRNEEEHAENTEEQEQTVE